VLDIHFERAALQSRTPGRAPRALATFVGLQQKRPGLFDLSDARVRALYVEARREKPEPPTPGDYGRWYEISVQTQTHLKKHPGPALIVIQGAGFHQWGAEGNLSQLGVGFVPTVGIQLGLRDVANLGEFGKNITPPLQVQIRHSLGVLHKLGYSSVESFYALTRKRALLYPSTAILLDETGFHSLYNDKTKEPIFAELQALVSSGHYRSVLIIGEDSPFESFQQDLDTGRTALNATSRFAAFAKDAGLPVVFGRYGTDPGVLGRERGDSFGFPAAGH
jgi:hypothetical protein